MSRSPAVRATLIIWSPFADHWEGQTMLDRRAELRMLCADVVEIHWTDRSGHTRHCDANLDDISQSGVGLQVEHPIPLLTRVHIRHEQGELAGKVKSCLFRETGYLMGVELEQRCRWSPGSFRPRHLPNPRRLKP